MENGNASESPAAPDVVTMLAALSSEVSALRRRCELCDDECRETRKKLKSAQKGYVFVYVITLPWLQEWDRCQKV
jgi:hypothetical protein